MPIAITAEQVQFHDAATRWAVDRDVRGLTRRLLADPAVDVGSLWRELADLGWTGLLVPESLGGSGAAWSDAAVLVEAFGAACAPLPLATTLAVSAVLAALDDAEAQLLCKGVADGSVVLGAAHAAGGPVLGGAWATHAALPVGADVAVYELAGVEPAARPLLDPSSGAVDWSPAGEPLVVLPGAAGTLRTVLRLLTAADCVGVASACLATAVQYAKTREAFGRTIGSFQAVKHHCADMLLSSQLATAATWRAADAEGRGEDAPALADGALFLATASALACAKTTLQVLGGLGFTWEHDLHLYLRRAGVALAQAGPREALLHAAGRSALDGQRPAAGITLPPEAEGLRDAAQAFRARVLALPAGERHAAVVDEGFLHPQWPAPWGRAAGPLEQLVLEEVLHDVDRRSALGPTYWEVPIILPTVLDCGTPEQIERWMRPSMLGELRWCQLFSEPSAGSDLAALATRAVRTEGGWLLTGQKVWTSDAHHADLGMALVRTDPDAPKHKGITCVIVDMRSPGVDIRPLRQITGEAHFNEVFLDDVFVPDADVLGPVNGGWGVARTTLGHERVSLSGPSNGLTHGEGWRQVAELVAAAADERPALLASLGEIVLTGEGATALHLRSAYRALLGQPMGVEGSIGKTVLADLGQRVGDFCVDALGPALAFTDGAQAGGAELFLKVRSSTIAGGTSEILRNLLAEQALGLPREPAAR